MIKPKWLAGACVLSLALGLQLLFFLLLPDLYPAVQDRIIDRSLSGVVLGLGLACTALPVSILYLLTRARG